MNSRKGIRGASLICAALTIITGCASPDGSRTLPATANETGPDNTIVYLVPVDSSEPGARIQVNGETVGTTPMTLKINGDRDGTFHNFGSYDFIVRAYPPGEGRPSETKVFKTGALFAHEDKIPQRIYFDFGPPPANSTPQHESIK